MNEVDFKQKYECKNCHSFYETERGREISDIKCCKKPDLELLQTQYNDDEIKEKFVEAYEGTCKVMKEYMDMPDEKIKLVSLWIASTYFHENFNTFPYLFFNAMRGSGKTRLLRIVSHLAAKSDGSIQNNMTEAVLFRVPPGTTTCIDEMEQVGSKDKQTLREILNSAYKKGMVIKRMRKAMSKQGEQQVAETFEPFFPIAMANIWGMDEVLGDRSISIILEKSNNPSVTKMVEDFDSNVTFEKIKRTFSLVSGVSGVTLRRKKYIESWNNYIKQKYNYTTTLTTQTPLTPQTTLNIEMEQFFNKIDDSGINGRNFELFFPLLLIAKEIGQEIFEEILKISSEIVSEKTKDEFTESKDVSVFHYISLKASDFEYYSVKELTRAFRTFIGEEDMEDRWINERWLGKALKRLGLLLDKRKRNDGMYVQLNVAKAKEKLKIFKVEERQDAQSKES